MEKVYLQRHLFEGDRLKRHAIDQFVAAIRSGRLIAFVGSYATEDCGYPKWDAFLKRYAKKAVNLARSPDPRSAKARQAIMSVKETFARNNDDALVGLSVIEYALAYLDEKLGHGKRLDKFEKAGARFFRLRKRADQPSNARTIVRSLGIDRVITLNYDLEFEWELMTTAGEKMSNDDSRLRVKRARLFKRLRKSRAINEDGSTRSLTRIIPGGRSVMSDVFNRERTDRLIEFAVGSPDYEAHILHLHGRVTHPETMIISLRDYNKQYRRGGTTRVPFEHALRILFAGNPILFLGVGMTEDEVTGTLENFVADNPSRHITSAFIIWNAPIHEDGTINTRLRDALRFKWVHRFGVLTLFDDELEELAPDPAFYKTDRDQRFAVSISNLALMAQRKRRPFPWSKEDFRSLETKMALASAHLPTRYETWPAFHYDLSDVEPINIPDRVFLDEPIKLFIGEPGIGKGMLAQRLREQWEETGLGKKRISLIVNASFVFETDSVFHVVSGIADGVPAIQAAQSRRKVLFDYMRCADEDKEILIIINGMERFFSPTGQPLSHELDTLIRSVIAVADNAQASRHNTPPFMLFLLGTQRVRRYFDSMGVGKSLVGDFTDQINELGKVLEKRSSRSFYLEKLQSAFMTERGFGREKLTVAQQTLIAQKARGDLTDLRRAILGAYLQPEALRDANVGQPDLCLDILMVMAFIGQPIEDAVLYHAPRVSERLHQLCDDDDAQGATQRREYFLQAFEDLAALKLVVQLKAFEGCPPPWRRFGLHRVVLAELRDRVGVPLSDSRLSTGFNISLYAAQLVDGYSPEPEIHAELDRLVDWLIGAYKDIPLYDYQSAAGLFEDVRWAKHPNESQKIAEAITTFSADGGFRGWPHASACLRAALSLIRSYYSTAALLSLDHADDASREGDDGPLTQHGERLDRLLRAATEYAEARGRGADVLHSDSQREWFGPPPFYADDLVWLHNERAVVKLGQGDLYEARHSLEQAGRINREFVEFGDHAQNWRRIMLNQLHVDIERAKLGRAEKRIAEIEQALADELSKPIDTIRKEILYKFGPGRPVPSHFVDGDYTHDTILTVALLIGYRALCLHLQGNLRVSDGQFTQATAVLLNIGEQRAYAMFLRHHASLAGSLGRVPDALDMLRLATAASEALRQTDIAFQSRITEAWYGRASASPAARSALLKRLHEALQYGVAADMHRIRIEANVYLARLRLEGGDYDVALEHAADAMSTATRFGLSLRKISLRILIGQLLLKRGDILTGQALLDRAIRNADRVDYQRAVELAQKVRDYHNGRDDGAPAL